MYLSLLMVVCQWWHWMKQARSESLGAAQHWDLVKWSLVTLCSTGEGEPLLTPLAQCLTLVQPHTPSSTSILVQCMKWELHQWALLDWVDTAVGVGSKLQLITVSEQQSSCIMYKRPVYWLWLTTSHAKSKLITQVYSLIFIADFRCQFFSHELRCCNSVRIVWHTTWYPVQSSWLLFKLHRFLRYT